MRLIQPQKFRIMKMGCFKMPRLQMPHLQMAVFQTGFTVASGLRMKPFVQGKKHFVHRQNILSLGKSFCPRDKIFCPKDKTFLRAEGQGSCLNFLDLNLDKKNQTYVAGQW